MIHGEAVTHIVSYPKSGRTWLRLIIAKFLGVATGLETTLEDLNPLTAAAGLAPIELTHAGANLPRARLLELEELRRTFSGTRILFVVRNFEDTLVSAYHQARFRKTLIDQPLSDYVRDPHHGARRLRSFLDSWAEVRSYTGEFCLIRYEDMHEDPSASLSRALSFCGVVEPDPGIVELAVAFCDFSNLQQMERKDSFTKNALRARDTSKVETYKFREGKVGSFHHHLSQEDQHYLREFLVDNRNDLIRSGIPGNS